MADQSDTLRIFPLATECDRLLTRFVAGTESSDPTQASRLALKPMERLAKDWQDRFNAWSSYLGVFAEEHMSLDRRLVHHADIRGMIIKLLEILRFNLQTVITTSQDGSLGRSIQGPSSSEDVSLRFLEEKKFVEGSIDRLHRLGVTIRRSSMASLRARVDAFADRSKSSIEELCSKAIERIYPLAPESLQDLLVQSILQRYFALLYREKHQRRISKRRSFDSDLLMDDFTDEEDKVDDKTAAPSSIAGPIVAPDKVLTQTTENSGPSTKPSTLEIDKFQRKNQSSDKPATAQSYATSIASWAPTNEFLYPKPPKWDQLSEYVSCSWCFEPLLASRCREARNQRTAWWRRHVDRDLTPYICLAEKCANPPPAFDRRSLWTAHMIQTHSANWAQQIHREPRWTCSIGHSTPIEFPTQDRLALHMREKHGELFNSRQIASIVRRGSGRSIRREGICPFRCSYDATQDPSVNSPSPACTTIGSLPFHDTSSGNASQKRPSAGDHRQNKRPRRVRFAEQSSEREDTDSSDVSTDKAEEGLHNVVEKPLQRALSRHIATHLLSLSFLTIRFKELQGQNSADPDDDRSITHLDSDSSNASNNTLEDSELDALSLNFEDSGPLPDDDSDAAEPTGPWAMEIDEIMLGTGYGDFQDSQDILPVLGDQADYKLEERMALGLCPGDVFKDVPHKDAVEDSTLSQIGASEATRQQLPSVSGQRHVRFEDEDQDEDEEGLPEPLNLDQALTAVGTGAVKEFQSDGLGKKQIDELI